MTFRRSVPAVAPPPLLLAVALCVLSVGSVAAFSPASGRRTCALCAHPHEVSPPQFDDPAPCLDGALCAADPVPVGEIGDGDDATGTRPAAPPVRVGEAIARLGLSTGPTVWSEFGRLAAERQGTILNLGQGFPDWLPPAFVTESLAEAASDGVAAPHQYTRTAGHPRLVKELAGRYSAHLGREVDAMAEVCVTVGASQALYLSMQTLLAPGDEVVVFEPFFDLYLNQIKLAGGTPVFVPLTFVPYDDDDAVLSGGDWILEEGALEKVISSKTRAIVLNSPHNPTGKIFTRAEMTMIADAAEAAGPQCVVLSDEVYKYIVHSTGDGNGTGAAPARHANGDTGADPVQAPEGHIHFATLPRMWDRTITISSAGKTFSATGWQVGWCVGPRVLVGPIQTLLPYVQFCASTVVQESLARSLPKADAPYRGHASYYDYLQHDYTRKRDALAAALSSAGFAVPDYARSAGGGFFIFARIGANIARRVPEGRVGAKNAAAPGGTARLDWALCQWMAEEEDVLCIPAGPFFSERSVQEGRADGFVRVAFCKKDETIEGAAAALLRIGQGGAREEADGNKVPVEIIV